MQVAGANEGAVSLGGVGSQILKLEPDFDPRTYGHRQLSALFRALPDHFEVTSANKSVSVRLKVKAKP
jgi:hypothetical protein